MLFDLQGKRRKVVQVVYAVLAALFFISFVGFGSLSVLSGDLSVGALAAGTMLSGRVLQPGLKAMGLWTQFQSVRLSMDRVEEMFSMPAEISGDYKSDEPIRGHIKLDNIRFKYPEQQQMLLDGISLDIPAGGSVGIMGHNGAGKSTLISLMTGFMHPLEGRILLDDQDLREYDQEYLRSQIGFVPQEGMLYEGTILENMTLFREGKIAEHAAELSRMLGLDEIIGRMPEGLDTQIGGAAVDSLSEGVRQKIIIVRSLVGHPQIMLFDDANANFDIKNDYRLMELIEQYKGNRTVVLVSHRPSFLKLCDRTFELYRGKLNETTSGRLKVVFNKRGIGA